MITFTQEQIEKLDIVCLELENDSQFYKTYTNSSGGNCSSARDTIRRFGGTIRTARCGIPNGDFRAAREYIRRHMDERYNIHREDDEQARAEFGPLVPANPKENEMNPNDNGSCSYIIDAVYNNQFTPKETAMKFTTQYLLNGSDVTKLTNEQIYAAISAEEGRIAKLKEIKTQPKRLQEEIAAAEAELARFVAFLDEQK